MKKVLVDTNIIIDHSKGFGEKFKKLFGLQKQKKLQMIINPIVIGEFFTDKNLNRKEALSKADRLFKVFSLSEVSIKDGFLAGEIIRKSQTAFLSDALIAANCINNDFELITNNQKDFRKVKKLILFIF